MTVIEKRPWETSISCYRIVLLSTGLVDYLPLEHYDDVSTPCEAVQVEKGRIKILFSRHRVLHPSRWYPFDRLSLVGGHMGRAIPVLQMIRAPS